MDGLVSLLQSRKFWIAIVGVGGVVLSESFGWEPEAVSSLTTAIVTIAGVLIAAIAVEDAAEKHNGPMDPPSMDAPGEY